MGRRHRSPVPKQVVLVGCLVTCVVMVLLSAFRPGVTRGRGPPRKLQPDSLFALYPAACLMASTNPAMASATGGDGSTNSIPER